MVRKRFVFLCTVCMYGVKCAFQFAGEHAAVSPYCSKEKKEDIERLDPVRGTEKPNLREITRCV
jgi:hypothetical protein